MNVPDATSILEHEFADEIPVGIQCPVNELSLLGDARTVCGRESVSHD
jgi:hypothetical protein